jgi:HSP20 family molecular chaperone IbpA
MWAEAVQALSRAERLHRQMFQPGSGVQPAWEPPVDVLETDREVLIFAALPGVDPDAVHTAIEDGALAITGVRTLPAELRTAAIHRLELPQGRFERRVPLPRGRYLAVHRRAINGCIVVSLRKA